MIIVRSIWDASGGLTADTAKVVTLVLNIVLRKGDRSASLLRRADLATLPVDIIAVSGSAAARAAQIATATIPIMIIAIATWGLPRTEPCATGERHRQQPPRHGDERQTRGTPQGARP